MLGIILALSVVSAAAGSRHLQYELDFVTSETYVFDYEGLVFTGLQEQGFAKSAVKLKCRTEISGTAPRLRFLKIRNIELQEYSGVWPADEFTTSEKLSELLKKQLAKPIMFEYDRGQVGDLHIPSGLSQTTANLLRGIVNILQLSIKENKNIYMLKENGIGGLCHNNYVIQEDQRANQLLVSKSIDLNDCEHREQMVIGTAYLRTRSDYKQRNKHSQAAATYNYKIKGTEMGGRLLEAEVREVHQFTPFNEIEGSVVVESRQRLVLQAVQELIHSTPENNDYISKESLRYHFERKLIQTPIHLLRTKSAERQISELLHHLVEHNIPLPKVSPQKYVDLVHLLRMLNYEDIVSLWKQFSGKPDYRRWFLDAVPSIGNHFSLRFLKVTLRELSEFEAAQSVPLALHLIRADREAIEEAKALLEEVKSGHSPLLHKVTFLAYGSLAAKFCSPEEICPEDVLQPVHDLLSEATQTMNHEDIILALKTLGNAGQIACIKHIMKFIPRFSSMASSLPLRVHAAAILSLRNIALKHPMKVSDICLQLYMDSTLHPRTRNLAAWMIMDIKPPASVVMTIARSLMKEGDMRVGAYVYYLMKKQSKCVLPDGQDVAAVCKMAVTILKSKYEATANDFQIGFHYDAYSDSLMSGIESEFMALLNPSSVFPDAALGRLRAYFMGFFADLFEIGYRSDGLQQLFMNRDLSSSQDAPENMKKIMEKLRKLHDWKPLPSAESLASVYLRFLGQEIVYHDLKKNSLETIIKFLPSGKYATLRSAVNALQNGVDINWSKPLLSSENRLLVPTCVGFPLETSLYYSSLTRTQLQVQTHITPEPTDPSFIQLLQSNLNLKSKFSISMAKDIVFTIGVNSDLIQAGMELRTKVNMDLPGRVEASVNVDQKHFRIDYIPVQQENEVLSIRSKAFAVTRNGEDLAAAKMTPVVAAGTEPNVLKQTFNPRDLSAGDTPRTEGKFAEELLSEEKTYSSDQPRVEAKSRDIAVCARTSHFGFQLCMEKKSLTAGFARSCPLYHVIGEHSFNLTVKPAHIDASVEKIRIEFQAGPGAAMKMVRSVNVRKTDGETRELENPIDYVALSKLKKILVSGDENTDVSQLENITSVSSGHNSSSSENITDSSMNSSSSARHGHAFHQDKKRHEQRRQHEKHQNKQNQKQHDKSREAHETDEHEHRDNHNTEEGIEMHCKCWPEKSPNQHGQLEHDEDHEAREHKRTQKDHHETHENKNPHKDSHESKGRPESTRMKHQNERKGSNRREGHDTEKHPHQTHGQHESEDKKRSCTCSHRPKENNNRKHQAQSPQKDHHDRKHHAEEDQSPHKDHRDRKHHSEEDQTPRKDHRDIKHHSEKDQRPRKDQRDRKPHAEEDQSPQKDHRDRKHQSEEDHSPRRDHHDRKTQAKEVQTPRKDHRGRKHQDEEDQRARNDQHDRKHHGEEDQSPHKDHHDRNPHAEEDQRPRKDHQGRKYQDEEDERTRKDQHDRKYHNEEDESSHKDHYDRRPYAEEDQRPRKDHRDRKHQDEEEQRGRKAHHDRKHYDEEDESSHKDQDDRKPHSEKDQRPRKNHNDRRHQDEEDQRPHKDRHDRKHNAEEDQRPRKDHHDSRSHHSQEHDNTKNDKKKCKFLSSESVQQSKKNTEHHAKNSGQNMQEDNARRGLKKHNDKNTKSSRKQWESISENHDVSKKQRIDSKNTQEKHWKTIRKSDRTKNVEIKNISQGHQSPSKKSPNYLELFAPEIRTAKFWSTPTIQSAERSGSSSSSSRMNEDGSPGTPPKVFLLVKSILSNGQHQGFQTTAYIDPHKSKAQVVTVPLDPKSSWKTCLDASVSGFHKASAMLRWGQNCQDYRVVSKFSTGELAGSPAVQFLWQWKSLPTWLKRVAGSVMTFAPSVAYTMGFSEMHHSSSSRQVTVRVAATSLDTYDVIVKTPELTVYKEAVPAPWDLSFGTHWRRHLQLIELTNLPKVSSLVGGTRGAQCKLDLQNVVTFDGRKLGCSLPPTSCYTVIAQDCTDQLRFLITMKKMGQGFSAFEMNVKLGSYDIKIYSDAYEDFRILLNGMWLLLKNDTYINEKDCIRIHRNATTVTVKAPKNGVEQIAFNGHLVKVQLTPLMHGKTCGLCGNSDYYPSNDFQKPNHETARSCNGLVNSWTVPDNSPGSSCALGWQYIMLENELIEERQSTCYSTEPVLNCVKGCHPAAAVPITVAFHCLPKESAMRLEDWQAKPKVSSEDLIKEVEAHASCECAEESAKI
ncbi:vitellogenin-1-like [Eleutherodactylus coqui]|uniref:vitellogenin-1-like n=1 Tax=Eleutherodactylus coqui TaxID=57060 RepID=UPI0034632F42